MSSSSSSNPNDRPLAIGAVTGRRGSAGELTVRISSGDAERWVGLQRVSVASARKERGRLYDVEGSRAYRDRLVLKLRSVDDAGAAEELRGRIVSVPPDQVPPLPDGEHFRVRLVGMEVFDTQGVKLGRVVDVVETGGADLLAVDDGQGEEILVPLASAIVERLDERRGRIEVQLPEGLRELNRRERDGR